MPFTRDFRVIAAANESLDALVAAGRFRFDLLQRVRAAVVRVPALEERVEDIHILAAVFAKRAQAHARPPTITEGAIRYLERRSWPGNVRELKHLVECATALSNDGIITRDDLASVSPSADHAISRVAFEVTERRQLVAILDENEWNLPRTAARLAVHRVTLWRRMCRLGIVRSRYAPGETLSRAVGDEDVATCCTPLRNTPAT